MVRQALTEPAFFILAALLDEPRHGYGIVGEVAELSGGRVRLKVGTLYGVLDRLVADGLIELDREEITQGRLRRYFRLTEGGVDALIAETERQAANVRAASERLRARRPASGRPAGGRRAAGGDRPDGVEPASPLELRYRQVLRLLPPSYRAVWADEMTATFLDGMLADTDENDPDWPEFVARYGRPSWSEVASVAALAVRLRLGTDGGPARYLAWGRALRLAALIGLFTWAVAGLAEPGMLLWMTGRVPVLPRPRADWVAIVSSFGLLTWVWQVAGLLWVAAFVALVTGRRRAAQVLAAIAVAPQAVRVVLGIWGSANYSGVGPLTWYSLGLGIVVAALPAVFHRDAPAVRALPWLLALPAAAAVVGAAPVVSDLGAGIGWPLAEWPGLLCIAFTVAATGSLIAARLGRTDRWNALSHALALLAPLLLSYRLITMWLTVPQLSRVAHTVPIAEAIGVSVTGVAVAVMTAGMLRRLPKTADPAAVING